MKKLLIACLFTSPVGFLSAQTCSGVVSLELTDDGGTSIGKDVKVTSVSYYKGADDHYTKTQPLYHWSKLSNAALAGVTATPQPEKSSLYASTTALSATDVEVKNFCGHYLVKITLEYQGKTMTVGVYNVPADKSFISENLKFQEGEFFMDLKCGEVKMVSRASGVSVIPASNMISFGHPSNLKGM